MPQNRSENPSAFKHLINSDCVKKMSLAITQVHSEFPAKEFMKVSKKLFSLELKQRVLLITSELKKFLPDEYLEALPVLLKAMDQGDLRGFELWPFSEYISQFGLEHFDESLVAMYSLTRRFTAEFAIRPFLLRDHKKVLKKLSTWVEDKDHHVRRWISEGTRPLLPWGQKIPLFVMDPTHTLLFLDKLRNDDELYVRKSVANHLNDISKNHPQVVVDILRIWMKDASEEHRHKILWIKRHALRTLIKKGHPGALKLLGVQGKAKAKFSGLKLNQKIFKISDQLEFSFNLESQSDKKQKLVVDYAIDFIKSGGKRSKKVFKLKTFELAMKEKIKISKKHSLRPITTMKYYEGSHYLIIQINGEVVDKKIFYLEI